MKRADIRLFLGKSGSGKTTLALHQAAAFERVLFHDPNAEITAGRIVRDPLGLVEAIVAGDPRIVWRGYEHPPETWDRIGTDAFEWANRAAYAAGGYLVVWDEVDVYAPEKKMKSWAYRILNSGRHRDLRVFACSRRPAAVNIALRALATRIAVFMTDEPADIKYLGERIGRDAAAKLPSLPRYSYLDWREGAPARVRHSQR